MSWSETIWGTATRAEPSDFVAEIDATIKRLKEPVSAIRTALNSPAAERQAKAKVALQQLTHIPLTEALNALANMAPIGVRAMMRRTAAGLADFCKTLPDRAVEDDQSLLTTLASLDSYIGRLRHARLTAVYQGYLQRLLMQAAVMACVAVSAVAGIWLNARHGFATHSQTIVFPRGPYAKPPQQCDLTTAPEQLDEYLTDFTEFYFHGTGKYPYRFWEKVPEWTLPASRGIPFSPEAPAQGPAKEPPREAPAKASFEAPMVMHGGIGPQSAITRAPFWSASTTPHTARLRTVLQNVSIWNVEPISSVTIRAKFMALARFPWHRLDYAPDVECRLNDGLTIVNHGLGPIVNLTCSLDTLDGLRLVQTHQGIKSEGGITLPVNLSGRELFAAPPSCAQADGFMIAMLTQDAAGQWELATPVTAILEQTDGAIQPTSIATLAELRKIARVVHKGKGVIRVEYESIHGQRYRHSFETDLPHTIAYYQFKPRPPGKPGGPYYGKPMCAAPAPTMDLFFLAAALHAPKINAESADHTIALTCDVDLKDVGLGESREQTKTVDKRLSPRGTINWEVSLKDPASGVYELTFIVNDVPVDSCRVHCFRPERMHFQLPDIETIRDAVKRAHTK